MKWASSLAAGPSLEVSLDQCLQGIQMQLGEECPDLVFCFFSPHFRESSEQITLRLTQTWNPRVVLGCTAGGVIGAGQEVEHQPALSLVAARLPEVSLDPFHLVDTEIPSTDGSPSLWEDLLGVEARRRPHFILLADPFTFRVEEFLMGLDYAYPRTVKVGGLASGGVRPGDNRLLYQEQVSREGIVGVAMSGNIQVETLVAQGCRPIGPPYMVTRSERNLLLELDYKPALQVLQDLLSSLKPEDLRLATQPLFLGLVMDPLREELAPGDFLIRNILGALPERGAIAVGALLSEGQWAQFHVRDRETSAEDLYLRLRSLWETLEGQPGEPIQGALLFSCLGRGVHLYGEMGHDTRMFHQVLGPIPMGGFFCNGEIGPVRGVTYLHGYTSSFGLFRPRKT